CVPPRGDKGSNPLPSAIGPDGETDIMPRFERDVPGSTPGRGATSPVVQRQDLPLTWGWAVVRIHPGLLHGRATPLATGAGWKPVEPDDGLAGSTPAPSAGTGVSPMVFVV